MGNVDSIYSSKNHLSRSRIEIIMADIDVEENEINNEIMGENNKSNLVLSHHSLSSIMSITSATQTEPELFTKWPKKQFMFNWLNKLKNYHSLLSKSQQLLSSNMFLNSKTDEFFKKAEIKSISLSTQTVNVISESDHFSNKYAVKSTEKFLSVISLKSEILEKPINVNHGKLFENFEENPIKTEIINNALNKSLNNENELLECGPLFKKPKLQKNLTKITNDSIISQLSNKFYRSEMFKPINSNNVLLESMDSLTSVTVLSKPDNKSLIFQSKTTPISYEYNGRGRCKNRSNIKNLNSHKNGLNDIKFSSVNGLNNLNKNSNIKRKRNQNQKSNKIIIKRNSLPALYKAPSIQSANDVNSLKNNLPENSGKVQIFSYKFWVTASGKNWEVFHNPTDRRIESIGRISKCRIQLTNYITRHSDGLLKQQVIVYAPNQSNLEKCCRLFDDKFPEFYASSGLLKILYFRKSSTWSEFWDSYKNILQVDLPIIQKGFKRQINRKRNSLTKKKQNQELSFLRNQLIKN